MANPTSQKQEAAPSGQPAATVPRNETHPNSSEIPVIGITFDPKKPDLTFSVNPWLGLAIALLFLAALLYRSAFWRGFKSLEIDEAEIGIGTGKLTLRPNYTDRQVAYQIWVELSTRKIGLPLDTDHDVIADVYDSWHQFFGVTRDLIKSIPASKVSEGSTRKIISLSIEVLNEGLRPHLTQWQARFRSWYEQQLKAPGATYEDPQTIQKKFGQYNELTADIIKVNTRLMAYRTAMHSLVYNS